MSTEAKGALRLLVIESPYAGDVAANVAFCEAVCRYAALQGYAPMASHLLYTRFLDDDVPEERRIGIDAGLAWASHAEEAWFCLRPGEEMSRGMAYARERHARECRTMFVKRFTQDGNFIEDESPLPPPSRVEGLLGRLRRRDSLIRHADEVLRIPTFRWPR